VAADHFPFVYMFPYPSPPTDAQNCVVGQDTYIGVCPGTSDASISTLVDHLPPEYLVA
jgi:hypothetical protein